MIDRQLSKICFSPDFGRQMRFIVGPRQIGKTTLAKDYLEKHSMLDVYFNWDLREIRDKYRNDPYFFETMIYDFSSRKHLWICFDEIHKMPKWKNILKDYFDKFEKQCSFIITGSARMDWFRKSGDSLAGRYFLFTLFPLSLSELSSNKPVKIETNQTAVDFIEKKISKVFYEQDSLDQLLNFSGFPEPCVKATSAFHRRWQRDMVDRLVREEIRDLTRIIHVENVATVMNLLPERVGSLLSLNALKEDVGISYNAIKNCISALQLSYAIFLVSPYTHKIARAIKKEKKCYFFDWTRCEDEARQFENFVAVELKSMIERWNDEGVGDYDMAYIRTKEGKESDFLILKSRKPWCLIEVKLQDRPVENHHYKNAKLLGEIPIIQICRENKILKKTQKQVYRVSASRFLSH